MLYELLYIIGGVLLLYVLFTLFLTYLVQAIPRNPVPDIPDWGRTIDTKIPSIDGGFLEVWRVEPDGPSRGTVIFAHGWGRNRGRMVSRARFFGQWGFTTVIHSARDHGHSSPRRFMNAAKFAEDIEAVLNWVGEPVALYGHSAGAGGAIMAAAGNQDKIKLLFLEACYAHTKEGLLSLYKWFNPFFGALFGPMIIFWLNLFYGNKLETVSPARLAPALKMPVMLVHGEKDRRFPLAFAVTLRDSFSPGQADLYVAEGAGHSESSQTPGYPDAVRSFLERNRFI
ncbi:MAG: alpha/beta fold hydrolase [Desulfobacterales bacterium]